jgi:hypothetical protein
MLQCGDFIINMKSMIPELDCGRSLLGTVGCAAAAAAASAKTQRDGVQRVVTAGESLKAGRFTEFII